MKRDCTFYNCSSIQNNSREHFQTTWCTAPYQCHHSNTYICHIDRHCVREHKEWKTSKPMTYKIMLMVCSAACIIYGFALWGPAWFSLKSGLLTGPRLPSPFDCSAGKTPLLPHSMELPSIFDLNVLFCRYHLHETDRASQEATLVCAWPQYKM